MNTLVAGIRILKNSLEPFVETVYAPSIIEWNHLILLMLMFTVHLSCYRTLKCIHLAYRISHALDSIFRLMYSDQIKQREKQSYIVLIKSFPIQWFSHPISHVPCTPPCPCAGLVVQSKVSLLRDKSVS